MYCLRNPKTTNERRANEVALQDKILTYVGVRIRRARLGHNLPCSFDDLPRSLPERSWKSYRQTQYKPVAVY